MIETPEKIRDRDDFIAFAETLRDDLALNRENVANTSLDSFLEALIAWANIEQISETESWQLAARLLRAGLSYE